MRNRILQLNEITYIYAEYHGRSKKNLLIEIPVIVDTEDIKRLEENLNAVTITIVTSRHGLKYYANAKLKNGKGIALHRFIMNTPAELSVHHKSHPLDNRKKMMENVTPEKHGEYHTGRKWGVN